jgi:hypothetical protein
MKPRRCRPAPAPRATRRWLRPLAPILLATALAGCYREAADRDDTIRPYTGGEPWSVDGIRPGQGLAQVKAVLGEPARTFGQAGALVHQWTMPRDVSITVDAQGTITEVLGKSVQAGGHMLVGPGNSLEEVTRVLGKGEVKTGRTPSGFVIQLGPGRVTSHRVTWRHGDARFEVALNEDRVAYVRAVLP